MNNDYDYLAMSKSNLVIHARALTEGIHAISKKAQHLVIENQELRERLRLIEQHRKAFQEFGK